MEEYKIIKTESVPIREVFPNEEKNFTPWLEKNLDLLKMGLKPYERESIVYDKLRIDLLVQSKIEELVAIENQYNTSDNDHFAKILVYITGSEATIGIWIAEEFKEQHKEVILNLNKKGVYNIYLIKVSAKKIIRDVETPEYIIDFITVIVPDIELREIAKTKRSLIDRPPTEIEMIQLRFWEHLLEKTKTKTKTFSGRSRSIGNAISTPASLSGTSYVYRVRKNHVAIVLYIDTRDKLTNKQIFDDLISYKDEIEEKFGVELIWERKDHAQHSSIEYHIVDVDYKDESKWNELHEEMSDKMVMFESAIKDYIKE